MEPRSICQCSYCKYPSYKFNTNHICRKEFSTRRSIPERFSYWPNLNIAVAVAVALAIAAIIVIGSSSLLNTHFVMVYFIVNLSARLVAVSSHSLSAMHPCSAGCLDPCADRAGGCSTKYDTPTQT